ncbi:Mss4-like protein [Phaeosphaeriaceae sp. PMI808]|nr:Mss4-like protein [Phaeosphaeriaceae sp. PMI808]
MPTGGCMCGNVTYEVQGDSGASILCHCYDCRKISGSTYSSNSLFSSEGFKVTKGTPKEHKKIADSGNEFTSSFCGDCGSTMWRAGSSFPGKLVIKAGTLDDTSIIDNYEVNAELFTKNRPAWVGTVEGAAQKECMQ